MTKCAQVVDFFSGCGGASAGFAAAGHEIRLGLDCDPHAAQTFRTNFPHASFIERDIIEVDVEQVASVLDPGSPVLFAGCAPCQPFSKQNRHQSQADPRRSLLHDFERFILRLKPDYVVLENVPGLQKVGDRGPLPRFLRALRDTGYSVDHGVLRTSDFGVPQMRARLVVVAALRGEARLPRPRGEAASTVDDAIAHLPPIQAGETHPADPDHASMRLSPLNLRRIRSTPEGGGRASWPSDLLAPCHRGHNGHSDVYGRMSWDRPSTGLTTRCLSYSNGRFGHPEQDRAISAREAANLQTFPESFRFSGPLTERGRQIGNAVPPTFAQRIIDQLIG